MFHVTARAGFEQSLFEDDEDRRTFIWLLRKLTTEFDIVCLAYCLMGTHYHLFLEGRTQQLAPMMRRLNGGYAHYFNERRDRHGHVFGQRYATRVILDDQHLERLYAYFETNPVEAGLCQPGERWPWMWFGSPVSSSGQAEACP